MEFKKTEGSIVSLENRTSISIDEMLGIVVCVVSDCYKNLDIKDVTDMSITDPKQMVLNLNAVATMLLRAANSNADAFNELKSTMSQKIIGTVQQLAVVESQYSNVSVDVTDLISKESTLKKKVDDLAAIEKEYRRLVEECDSLQKKINLLSDIKLDEIRQRRDSLSAEVAKRQGQRDGLSKEIEGLEQSLNGLNTGIQEDKVQIESINGKIDNAKTEKIRLEGIIANLQKELDEIEKWNREFPEIHKGMLDESKRHEAMMAQLRTSMNGIFSDEFLKDNLFSKTENVAELTPQNYPDLSVVTGKINSVDDLRAWSDAVMKRIQGLLAVYQEELRRLVECSKNIYEQ